MRIEFPPSSRNVLLGGFMRTVSDMPAALSGGFPRISVAPPGGFPRIVLALGLPAAIRARSMHWKYDTSWA
eukprot:4287002-Pyramimonas_sp.AAC.1